MQTIRDDERLGMLEKRSDRNGSRHSRFKSEGTTVIKLKVYITKMQTISKTIIGFEFIQNTKTASVRILIEPEAII
jgi:hypothetical protein